MVDSRFSEMLDRFHIGGDFAYYWYKNETGEGKKYISQWFHVSERPDVRENDYHKYFCVHPTNVKKDENGRTTVSDISAVNVLFLDFDSKEFGGKEKAWAHVNDLPQPSIIIDSGNGFHIYYLLNYTYRITDESSRAHIQYLQKSLVYKFGGDKSASDLARVMRIPGTKNYKQNPPLSSSIVFFDLSIAYPISWFENRLRQRMESLKNEDMEVSLETPLTLPIRLIFREFLSQNVEQFAYALSIARKGAPIERHQEDGSIRRYKSRSEAQQGLLSILILNGYSYSQAESIFDQYMPSRYMEEKDVNPGYLVREYNRAILDIMKNETRQKIAQMYHLAIKMAWPGRTGSVDKAIMTAILSKCYRFKDFICHVSMREIAEHAGITAPTASNGVKRLVSKNFIQKIENGNMNDATVIDITPFVQNVYNFYNSQNTIPPNDYCKSYIHKSSAEEDTADTIE